MSTSEPAACTAANSSIVTKPSPRPTRTCVSSAPMNPPVSSGTDALVTPGAAASASAAANPNFTRPGMPRVLNGGATNTHAVARTSPSTNAVTWTGSIVNVTVTSTADELGQLVEELDRERDELVQHPAPGDDEHDRDAGELRHERQRDLLHLRRRLDQRDEQTEAHRDEQDRREQLHAQLDRLQRDVQDGAVGHRVPPGITARASVEARDERLHDERPSVHHHEQQQLERQRHEDGREHEHAHRHQRGAHDEVDHEERDEDDEPDDE